MKKKKKKEKKERVVRRLVADENFQNSEKLIETFHNINASEICLNSFYTFKPLNCSASIFI